MNNDKLKFVVDSRSFDGSCVTTMSDGIHGDYHHETLEELRDREKNPCLTAVSGNTVRKMIRIHLQSLCAPFSEITEERYFDYMDVLPPSAIPGISFPGRALSCGHLPVLLPGGRTLLHGTPLRYHAKEGAGTADGQPLPEHYLQRRHPERKADGHLQPRTACLYNYSSLSVS